MCESYPVKNPKDHLLLNVGTELYKVSPDPDTLLPHLIKNNPVMPVLWNHKITITVNTASEFFLKWFVLHVCADRYTYMEQWWLGG